MNSSPKSLLDRLVGTTVTIVLVALGLSWAWQLVRPLESVAVTTVCVVAVSYVATIIRRHRDSGW